MALPSRYSSTVPLKKSRKEREPLSFEETLSSVDEVPDFHDPFSDLSLFLFKHLKNSLPNLGFPKKWTLKLQENLIKSITPEFSKKFPFYRLGVSALKKAFEKLLYFCDIVKDHKEAFSQDGKLNLSFLIRENLKTFRFFTTPSYLQPYHFAQQLALKIGECMAVIDGNRPKIEALTKTVWAIQRHLLKELVPKATSSPYDGYDFIDQLIVKIILETTAKEPLIGSSELEQAVKENLKSLNELPAFSSLDQMNSCISALLAEKLYPTSRFHSLFSSLQKEAVLNFLNRHLAASRDASPSKDHSEIIRRILALYSLAANLPKDLTKCQLKEALKAIYPFQKEKRPSLNQSVYAFLSAELLLMRNDEHGREIDEILEIVFTAYQEAALLPALSEKEREFLEIALWKQIGASERVMDRISYSIGQRIEEEIVNLLLDNPLLSFSSLVYRSLASFKKIKALSLEEMGPEIEQKIRIWTLQSDMLCRWIHLDQETPLLRLIHQSWEELSQKKSPFSHEALILQVFRNYLKNYPDMELYIPHLKRRILLLYKFCFYSSFGSKEESSLDRFIKWHEIFLKECEPHLSQKELGAKLREIAAKRVPLVPSSLIAS
ncbi:MAG: hypothetical protein A2Y28_01900 [Chlamydiae bacterium GWC2_50_10]|nr:MAG: hypothetical protein A2Z85_00040 [Chlamydiae bacterium GWA2_50_15]OGN53638.1 MAG: hypothetical protein A2Y28_01900 [Chlamydiae bacterium GWC2_50_10]OGN54558.1 MAG: hypothetical protein A2098_00240 [Chlamydiae bacterium GWF2_49_8]OGN58895.1 MAG: hypothetical protein A3D18_01475 [Chlamydiae bacterium RIFCSPHIGHO2_02_FULL_49_29]OGN67800.1 MAG: hypothetical protein A3I15_03660 [Chlamydiae bacterium RIFCSPLOWO2_02_FULL_49_12]HAZ15599.1 hypothetical protein [Parachlamydiales bacterium]